jgi:hypothetical protein
MEVIIVFLTSAAILSLHKNRKRNNLQNVPDGTSEKVAIDANTNIPSDSRVFGSLNQRK